jgi:hypothetical protein
MDITGYLHPEYIASLAEFGNPVELPHSGGWILSRPAGDGADRDGMGPYPLFCCQDWAVLEEDLTALESDLVALSMVTDPFGAYNPERLKDLFPDVARPFKRHHRVDLSQDPGSFVSAHHRRNAQKALRVVQVEWTQTPVDWLEDWIHLYGGLVKRHQIQGLPAFSRQAFARQLEVPGALGARAVESGETVGMLIWYLQGEVGYYHLGAHNPRGYDLGSSFALFWEALHHFSRDSRLNWLNLGAGAGLEDDPQDGLSLFKKGWSTSAHWNHFCGRIFDRERYRELTRAKDAIGSTYFPAYRVGEFGG